MPSALNVPNMLSLSRIFLAPLVVFLLTVRIDFDIPYMVNLGLNITYGDVFAGVVFIVAALTDTADGYIARKKGMVTNFGKFIDPLSDKVLVVAALISLVELGRLPAWMVVVIVSRDFVVSGLRMVAAVEGVVIPASWSGKTKNRGPDNSHKHDDIQGPFCPSSHVDRSGSDRMVRGGLSDLWVGPYCRFRLKKNDLRWNDCSVH